MLQGMHGITHVGCELYGNVSLTKPFQALQILRLEDMAEWEKWDMLRAGGFSSLKELSLRNCCKLTGDLPKHITSLEKLEIEECPELLASLPGTLFVCELVLSGCQKVGLSWHYESYLEELKIMDMPSLVEFPIGLCKLAHLEHLNIEGCSSLLSFPDQGWPPTLRSFRLEDCDNIKSLPEGMHLNSCLQDLYIWNCQSLKSFGNGGPPPSLTNIQISCCPMLEFPLSDECCCYRVLQRLRISYSHHSLRSLPLDLFPRLANLRIEGCANFETFAYLQSMPEQGISRLPFLRSLSISCCPQIESFPVGGLPSKLELLDIENCNRLMAHQREWGLERNPFLRVFAIGGEEGLEIDMILPATI